MRFFIKKLLIGTLFFGAAVFCLWYIYDLIFSVDYDSQRFKQVQDSVQSYVNEKFGEDSVIYISTHWNKHGFYMDGCKFYSIILHVDYDLEFEVLSSSRSIIGDTYNQKIWERKLNEEYQMLVNNVFGENAVSSFTFTFDYFRSSQEIDNLTDVATFNEYINLDRERIHERTYELGLNIMLLKSYNPDDQIGIDKVLTHLNVSGINYGSVTFEFSDVSKTYFYTVIRKK